MKTYIKIMFFKLINESKKFAMLSMPLFFFSSYKASLSNKDFADYPFREWVKIGEILPKFALVILILVATSCEDVVEVELQSAPERLVIEASLDWEKGTLGNEQTIRLQKSTAFYNTNNATSVTGASVKVTNDTNGAEFIFTDQNNGEYTISTFVPIIDQSYTLEVIYNGETYSANETLNAVPPITDIFQGLEDGFEVDELEVHVIFTDFPEEGNSVFFKAQKRGDLLPFLEVGFDEFINGNEIDWWIEIEEDEETDEKEAFQPGDVVDIEMYAISIAYKDYMEILINQIGGSGLFDTTPVSIKGNCINLTNPDNYAHGYFRLTEFNKTSYTFE